MTFDAAAETRIRSDIQESRSENQANFDKILSSSEQIQAQLEQAKAERDAQAKEVMKLNAQLKESLAQHAHSTNDALKREGDAQEKIKELESQLGIAQGALSKESNGHAATKVCLRVDCSALLFLVCCLHGLASSATSICLLTNVLPILDICSRLRPTAIKPKLI